MVQFQLAWHLNASCGSRREINSHFTAERQRESNKFNTEATCGKGSDSALMATRDTPSVRGGYYRKGGAACWFNSVQGRSRKKKKKRKKKPNPPSHPTWNCLLHASVCGVSFLRCGATLAVCLQKRCQDSSLRNGGLSPPLHVHTTHSVEKDVEKCQPYLRGATRAAVRAHKTRSRGCDRISRSVRRSVSRLVCNSSL